MAKKPPKEERKEGKSDKDDIAKQMKRDSDDKRKGKK
jgi:hypothetical protein